MKKLFALALVLCLVFALCACGESGGSNAAEGPFAPDGPVTLVVAYKAGSGTDNTARLLAKYAEKYVGQTIVIENVEGASGSQGWSQLAKADPDGMTIGFINLPNFNSNIVAGKGSYGVDSFKAICNHVTETSIVVVRADRPGHAGQLRQGEQAGRRDQRRQGLQPHRRPGLRQVRRL